MNITTYIQSSNDTHTDSLADIYIQTDRPIDKHTENNTSR